MATAEYRPGTKCQNQVFLNIINFNQLSVDCMCEHASQMLWKTVFTAMKSVFFNWMS